MRSRSIIGGRSESFPHARYGVDTAKMPDTYIEPFTAYRVWNWDENGVSSLNGKKWTPKVAFEAQCEYRDDWKSMFASASDDNKRYWQSQEHHCPDVNCTCGMYAGINMQHLLDLQYIQRGIHGEVSLWGRLYRHTLGWRAQFAYPKFFIVPAEMIPFDMTEAKRRLDELVEFGVDIFIQPESEAKIGQVNIPLWVTDFGYSQQGLSFLIEKRKNWYAEHPRKPPVLAVGNRIAVLGIGNLPGIGIVTEVTDKEVHYSMFNADVIYRKSLNDLNWSERNSRWETRGTGAFRRLRKADGG